MENDDLDISIIEDDASIVSSEGSSEGSSECSLDDMHDREPLSEIDLFFIYINSENAIDKVEKTVEPIIEKENENENELTSVVTLSKERLLQIVQTQRTCDGKKYRLNEIMSFQIPLEYSDLNTFIKGNDDIGNECLQTVPIFNEVVIHPALYVFHDLTALYFFFSEAAKPLKSVLRNGSDNRVTKKVRINDVGGSGASEAAALPYDVRKRKSLKRFLRRSNNTRKAVASVDDSVASVASDINETI